MGEEEDYGEPGPLWPPAWAREVIVLFFCLVTALAIAILIARPPPFR